MYRIGEDIGSEYARRLKKIIEETGVELDKEAMLEQVYCAVMQSGWGTIEIEWINLKDHKIRLRCRNLPCHEIEGCSCALERGITAGAYREIIGERVYFALCEKNDDTITFDSLKEIPPEVLSDEELALLSKTELEEVIREKTLELEKSRVATLNIAQDLKKAKKELQESEEKFRAIVETAEDSIFVKDRQLNYVMGNPAMELLFGIPCEELLGKSDTELFGVDAGKHIEEVDRQVLKGETVEEVHSKPVGEEIKTFHVIKVPLRDTADNIIGLCGIARDVTEQKRMDDELKKSMAELERFNRLAVGRELKMIELKNEVNRLCERLGEEPRYRIASVKDEKLEI
jgi:PAS domain S-box-containing protein